MPEGSNSFVGALLNLLIQRGGLLARRCTARQRQFGIDRLQSARRRSRSGHRCVRWRYARSRLDEVSCRLGQAGRIVRCPRRLVRLSHPAVQHRDFHASAITITRDCRSRSRTRTVPGVSLVRFWSKLASRSDVTGSAFRVRSIQYLLRCVVKVTKAIRLNPRAPN
jgi:hypothetical protein